MEDSERAELSRIIISSFIVIIGVEFIIIIIENLRMLGGLIIGAVNFFTKKDSKNNNNK